MKLQVVVVPELMGGFSAFVPGFPGCTSCGETLDETLANIREAFEGVFEVIQDRDFEGDEYGSNPIRETIEL